MNANARHEFPNGAHKSPQRATLVTVLPASKFDFHELSCCVVQLQSFPIHFSVKQHQLWAHGHEVPVHQSWISGLQREQSWTSSIKVSQSSQILEFSSCSSSNPEIESSSKVNLKGKGKDTGDIDTDEYPERVTSLWKIGAHVSAAGGVENSITNAASIGYESMSSLHPVIFILKTSIAQAHSLCS